MKKNTRFAMMVLLGLLLSCFVWWLGHSDDPGEHPDDGCGGAPERPDVQPLGKPSPPLG